jgi:hypothetical protein
MPRSRQSKRARRTIEAKGALAKRVIQRLHKTIDDQIERACDLEVQFAWALYRCGKAELVDADVVMREARRRVALRLAPRSQSRHDLRA